MPMQPETVARFLRQTAEAESFRWIVERRHLTNAATAIESLNAELEAIANKLADVWIHLDSWARGEAPSLEFVQGACRTILQHQQAPGWKDSNAQKQNASS